MTKKKYFGTDGIRGHMDDACMHPQFLLKLGWAIGTVLRKRTDYTPYVLMGCDTRFTGAFVQSALQAGLLSAGVNVTLLGVIGTPAIAYLAKRDQASAGIVVSASHNAYEDNGIKLIGSNGFKLSDDEELLIEKYLDKPLCCVSCNDFGEVAMQQDAVFEYVSHCIALFKHQLKLQDCHVVLDCANGATSAYASDIFVALGAHVSTIHATPNGKNINAECGATHLESLKKQVLNEQADVGIAFDGDGDRLMMVDHRGEIVDGDEILCLLAIQGDKHNAVAGTLMSNLGLEQALMQHKIAFTRTAVGDRYVLSALQENNWHLGGESSGHIVNLKYATTGDGILTALQVLSVMQKKQETLHVLKQVMQKRPQVLLNVPVSEPQRFSMMSAITEAAELAQQTLQDQGRVLLRASGTESCVRVMVECNEISTAKSIAESLVEVVERCFNA